MQGFGTVPASERNCPNCDRRLWYRKNWRCPKCGAVLLITEDAKEIYDRLNTFWFWAEYRDASKSRWEYCANWKVMCDRSLEQCLEWGMKDLIEKLKKTEPRDVWPQIEKQMNDALARVIADYRAKTTPAPKMSLEEMLAVKLPTEEETLNKLRRLLRKPQ